MAKRTKELGLGRGLNALLGDPELREMAQEEMQEAREEAERLREELNRP